MRTAQEEQARASARLQNISLASARLQAKIDAGHPKAAAYRKRLDEYIESLEIAQLEDKVATLKSKRAGDVEVGVPTGSTRVKGQ